MNEPLLHAAGIAFKLCVAATVVLAGLWLTSNIWQVPPDGTAVVMRFGRVADIRSAGLVLALPRPIDRVVLLPGPERQLSLSIDPLPRPGGLDTAPPGGGARAGGPAARVPRVPPTGTAGVYLTADGGAVLLDAELTFSVIDPVGYMLESDHVEPALNRIFRAAAIAVAARYPLDDFLVVDQTRGENRAAASLRLREALLAEINRRLHDLPEMGVEVDRVDLTASLPPAAKEAFDAVLTATQAADQELAQARTDATRRAQSADRERDRILSEAQAAAAEQIAAARMHADTALALAQASTPATREDMLEQLYQERIGPIIERVGQVIAVDGRAGPRLILPAEHK